MTAELEVAPNVPPDWRDWVNNFPSIKSIALFCFVAWILTGLVLGVGGIWGYVTGHDPSVGLLGVLDRWLDALNWLTTAAVFGVVGKRATEKPEIIVAEAQARATTAAATAALNSGSGDADPTMRPQ